MGVTFAVDDVAPARERMPETKLAKLAGDVLVLGGDGSRKVIELGGLHPLIAAVHHAFAEHRPLVLGPDAVWTTIAQGVAQHVRLNAEKLRARLVRHDARKTLTVTWPERSLPTSAKAWTSLVSMWSRLLEEEMGAGRARLFTAPLSTTTEVDRVAAQVVMMDAVSPYYDFELLCVCGIPTITLRGTVDDWRALRARVDVIAEFDLDGWVRSLAPILDQFVAAAEGRADVAFWQRIYKPRDAYGGDVITGWIARLFPYLTGAGTDDVPNPLLALAIDQPRGDTRDGVAPSALPAGPSRVRIVATVETGRRVLALEGGVTAVAQDRDGSLEPICGWALRNGTVTIDDVATRLVADHQASPPSQDPSEVRRLPLDGPAEVLALVGRVGEVRFATVGGACWLRPVHQHDTVRLTGASWDSLHRIIDLPDGTFVAWTRRRHAYLYVRVPDASVQMEAPGAIAVMPRSGSVDLTAADLPLLGSSLATILTSLLDRGPDALVATGMLADART